VVRCDLHPDDPEIQELARLIHRATRVVPLAHIEAIYRHAGFVPVCEADTDVRIDVYHSMYGKVFTKPATDSKPTTD
jgi:glycine/D-amino acid oxidase-like deaminating enzyme